MNQIRRAAVAIARRAFSLFKAFSRNYDASLALLSLAFVGAIFVQAAPAAEQSLPSGSITLQPTTGAVAVPKPATSADTTNIQPTHTTQFTEAAAPKTTTTTAIDFSLSQTDVTLPTTGHSPVMSATSTTGKPLYWAILAGNGIVVNQGITSVSSEVTHTFSFNPSPAITTPGTYVVKVMGYIPKGPSITKTITVTITQGATFTLSALAPNYSQDTATQFFIPFQITPIMGVKLGSLSMSAVIISSNGSPMTVQGVWDDGGSYVLNKKVAIMDYGQASGHLVVRVSVSDGVYATSLDIPYDVQTN